MHRMLRCLVGLVVALVVIAASSFGAQPHSGIAGGAPQAIVMGDSIAAGFGVAPSQSWPAVFGKLTGNNVTNVAVSGERSASFISGVHDWPSGRTGSQLDEATALVAEAGPGSLSALAIGIGVNDWLWLRDPASNEMCVVVNTSDCDDLFANVQANFEDSLDTILSTLNGIVDPGTPILVMTNYNVWDINRTARINDIIAAAVEGHGLMLADVHQFFQGREPELLADTVHPNPAGHELIAQIFSNTIPPDTDNDGLADVVETHLGSEPTIPDTDGDGCADGAELMQNAANGGERDPLNPWDFYDVAGFNNGPPDGVVDLANDILGVVLHLGTANPQFDRGPSAGPYAWNMGPPDGYVDISNDLLGVISQYGHRCASIS